MALILSFLFSLKKVTLILGNVFVSFRYFNLKRASHYNNLAVRAQCSYDCLT